MLSITDISVRIAGRLLIDQSSVQIVPGARVGFVGRNGVGKSTLFHAIRGDLPTESGSITIPPRWRIGSLAQEAPDGPESLVNIVLKADLERNALLQEAETAHDPHRIAEIQTRLVDIDAHAAPDRAAAILSGLGFSTADQARPCSEFSGGWRMRVALAATLFAAPDLLLLDEPTNYLDLEGTLWLEDHLANYPRTVIVISHDRDLLETSVDQILHLDRGKLTLYRGSYSSFEEQRATREKLDANRLAPFSGTLTRADKLSIAYFAQHQLDELSEDGSPYEHVRKLMPEAPESKIRARAGAIGFSGKAADTSVKSLSGGEKARLLLGLATFFGPNMIILDEPTNHLDIDSRAVLAEAINDFPGAVIMVSHDRYLIEACADQLWVVADRAVATYDGDLEDYRRMVLSANGVRTASRERNGNEREKPQRNRGEKRTPLRQQISNAEAEIARIGGIIEKIDTALALPDIFTRDPKQAAQLAKARAAAADALQRAEEEWLEASTQSDEAASQRLAPSRFG